MKKISVKILIVLMFSTVSCIVQRPGTQQNEYYSSQLFYDELAPYGDWIHNREYGYVWIPHVSRNFYPYATNGQWVMSDYGWTWVSDYPWGWAAFHYGRWDYDDYYGWVWFPDNEWAPAWVNWRMGDGYLGWAPMGPGMSAGIDYSAGFNEPGYDKWVFVRERDFAKPHINRYYVNRGRNDDIFRSTRVIDNVHMDNQRRVAYFSGPDPSEVQRATGRTIRSVNVRDYDRPGHKVSNNELQIYRPRIESNAAQGTRPAPSRITDIKDIRPMRERNRSSQPEIGRDENRSVNQGASQGQRQPEDDMQIRKERESRRQIEEKQGTMQKRQQQVERERDSADQMRRVQRENTRQQTIRRQQTDQQKKEMQKERERRKGEAVDTTRTQRNIREQSTNVRQKRR